MKKKILKTTVKNPFDKSENFQNAIISIQKVVFNVFDKSGEIFFYIFKSKETRNAGDEPIGKKRIPIGQIGQKKENGQIVAIAFDDIYLKSENIIFTLLKDFWIEDIDLSKATKIDDTEYIEENGNEYEIREW